MDREKEEEIKFLKEIYLKLKDGQYLDCETIKKAHDLIPKDYKPKRFSGMVGQILDYWESIKA